MTVKFTVKEKLLHSVFKNFLKFKHYKIASLNNVALEKKPKSFIRKRSAILALTLGVKESEISKYSCSNRSALRGINISQMCSNLKKRLLHHYSLPHQPIYKFESYFNLKIKSFWLN